jgi:hypothetical protein
MELAKPYSIHFSYEIIEEAIEFPLQANVTLMPNNTYLIGNIRHAGKASGTLLPPLNLMKYQGSWVYVDSKKETALSHTIGKAIESQTPFQKTIPAK